MALRGGQPGNTNGANGLPWQKALERALAHAKGSKDDGLFEIAQLVVADALAGKQEAWQEIGNRMDGKPRQTADVALTGDVNVTRRTFDQGSNA